MRSKIILQFFSQAISRVPRIKGLGLLIALIADRYSGEDFVVEKRVWGNRMRFRTNDLIGRMMIFSHNYYDWSERKLIAKIVKTGDYVLDVGANVGVYTLVLASLVGKSGRVDAIEAERSNFTELQHNVSLNGLTQVIVHHCGVSDREETLPLRLNTTGNAGSHSFFDQSHIAVPQTQLVSCLPLARIVAKRRPAFMKMDIEGFEHRVLATYFAEAPREHWPAVIMLENNPLRREADPVALCLSNGYKLLRTIDFNVFLALDSVHEVTDNRRMKAVGAL